jgi:hypothetical protein
LRYIFCGIAGLREEKARRRTEKGISEEGGLLRRILLE